jgi:hypothetical protein
MNVAKKRHPGDVVHGRELVDVSVRSGSVT